MAESCPRPFALLDSVGWIIYFFPWLEDLLPGQTEVTTLLEGLINREQNSRAEDSAIFGGKKRGIPNLPGGDHSPRQK
jgi:hypothetical protein